MSSSATTRLDLYSRHDEFRKLVIHWLHRNRDLYSRALYGRSRGDFISDVWLRLYKSLRVEVQYRLSTLVYKACLWECVSDVRSRSDRSVKAESVGRMNRLADRSLCSGDDDPDELTWCMVLLCAKRLLNRRSYSIFYHYMFLGESLEQVSSLHKITRERARQINRQSSIRVADAIEPAFAQIDFSCRTCGRSVSGSKRLSSGKCCLCRSSKKGSLTRLLLEHIGYHK